MRNHPLVSIIIPAFNRAGMLIRCVASVQGQTLKEIEIVVVDDGSSDNSAEVVGALREADDRIRYVKLETNAGVAAARDRGIAAADADHICTLDSDDVFLDPGKLERELELATTRRRPDRAAIGYSTRVLLDENLDRLKVRGSGKHGQGNILFGLLTRSLEIPRDYVYPKDLYFEVGGYDPEIAIYEDWDLHIRLSAKADFHHTDLEGVGYVRHDDGLSAAGPSEHRAWLSHVFRKNVHLLPDSDRELARETFREYLRSKRWNGQLAGLPALTERERLGEGLIYLLALPRAGSTLLQRILDGHPDIFTQSETWLLLPPLHALEEQGLQAPYNHGLAARAARDFIDLLPGRRESYLYWLRTCYSGMYHEILRQTDSRYFLDKTPRYHLVADDLLALFPRAKFILLWRHPLAVLWSMYERVGRDLAGMTFWLPDLLEGYANLQSIRGRHGVLEVFYEELVADPEAETARVLAHLKLPLRPDLLDWPAGEKKAWSFGDARQAWAASKPSEDRVDAWKEQIGTDKAFAALAKEFFDHVKREIKGLPYDLDEMAALLQSVEVHHRFRNELWFFHTRSASDLRRGSKRRNSARETAGMRFPATVAFFRKLLHRAGPRPYAIGERIYRFLRNRF